MSVDPTTKDININLTIRLLPPAEPSRPTFTTKPLDSKAIELIENTRLDIQQQDQTLRLSSYGVITMLEVLGDPMHADAYFTVLSRLRKE